MNHYAGLSMRNPAVYSAKARLGHLTRYLATVLVCGDPFQSYCSGRHRARTGRRFRRLHESLTPLKRVAAW